MSDAYSAYFTEYLTFQASTGLKVRLKKEGEEVFL